MIRIRMEWGKILRLTAEGHAGHGEPGQDIVCAGISAVTQTLAARLMELEKRGRVRIAGGKENGRIEIAAAPRRGNRKEVSGLYEMTMTGLRLIEREYPKNVSIEEEWS